MATDLNPLIREAAKFSSCSLLAFLAIIIPPHKHLFPYKPHLLLTHRISSSSSIMLRNIIIAISRTTILIATLLKGRWYWRGHPILDNHWIGSKFPPSTSMVVLLVCLSMVADDHLKTPSHPLHVRPELNFKDLLLDSPPMYCVVVTKRILCQTWRDEELEEEVNA